ncbi:unnamed protein product [Rangifer tarandus platyrhynchus]|uniref:Uncharacterized protein n=1 Tax=Rangifer tarandus platyrhynchus TaxID=3082113 RepID=A0AC59Y9P8_RANTA
MGGCPVGREHSQGGVGGGASVPGAPALPFPGRRDPGRGAAARGTLPGHRRGPVPARFLLPPAPGGLPGPSSLLARSLPPLPLPGPPPPPPPPPPFLSRSVSPGPESIPAREPERPGRRVPEPLAVRRSVLRCVCLSGASACPPVQNPEVQRSEVTCPAMRESGTRI